MSNSDDFEKCIQCIRNYIEKEYVGGLIGISDLANLCQEPEGFIFVVITELENQGEVRIITRYFCPDTHYISDKLIPYCSECKLKYPKNYLHALVFTEPIKNINK